jgi:hypothetical protein
MLLLKGTIACLVCSILLLIGIWTRKAESDWRYILLMLVLLTALFVDQLLKKPVECLTFDTDRSVAVLERFSLFGSNHKAVLSFDRISFRCITQKRRFLLVIFGFPEGPTILDSKYDGFSAGQINDMNTLIWSLDLPIETVGKQISIQNH